MTHKQGAKFLGALVLLTIFVSEYAAFTHTRAGTIIWLVGILVLTIVSPAWGFCLGRCNIGRGHERFKLKR